MSEAREIEPTQNQARELFSYEDGVLYWLVRPANRVDMSKPAGHLNKPMGRQVIKIKGKLYLRARLIWIMHHREITAGFNIDHIDRDRMNDRIENLRLVTNRQNQQNRSDQSVYGVGVARHHNNYADGSPMYHAVIRIGSKKKSLGCYRDPAAARAAYAAAVAGLGDVMVEEVAK